MYRYEKKLEKAKKKGIRFEEFELEYIEIARTHGLGVLEMYGAALIKAMTEAKNQKKRERIRQLLWSVRRFPSRSTMTCACLWM